MLYEFISKGSISLKWNRFYFHLKIAFLTHNKSHVNHHLIALHIPPPPEPPDRHPQGHVPGHLDHLGRLHRHGVRPRRLYRARGPWRGTGCD